MPAHEARKNRLAQETSPYLLQHAENPVDWYAWGDEALERARREDKPILLSIGYSACHWCHVMAHECFENDAIATLMNDGFVCIKVDREERPDLDDVYMGATLALNGSGGWPMTVFLTPECEPFFAGTYFPPQSRGALIGFPTLLERIRELWRDQRADVVAQAGELTGHLRARVTGDNARASALAEPARDAVAELRAAFDPVFGGFGAAPKFPPCAALELLLRAHRRSGDASLLEMVTRTLDAMAAGGMYDLVGGGFHRYSVDRRWLVPHFEKMLYDNAQLVRVYLHAFQVTGDASHARVARETLDYVLREMQAPDGGYYSSTDADSEGEEGKYFVFTPREIHELLEPRLAQLFCAYYGITPVGNWEGASILSTPRPLAEVARQLGLSVEQAPELLEVARKRVFAVRQKRVPPLLDDKILTSWNGLMLAAMADGARILGDARYHLSAERAARFALSTLRREDGGLYRTARQGKARLNGFLEDYAFLADGLISLYEAAGRFASKPDPSEYLIAAKSLMERALTDFAAEDGAFFATAHDHERLLVRSRDGHDGALPSPNAVAARALARLSRLLDRRDWQKLALGAVEAHAAGIEHAPRAFATSLEVLDLCREPPVELVAVGAPGEAALDALLAEAARVYLPHAVWAVAAPGAPRKDASLSLLRGKGLVQNAPAFYVCRNFSCLAPITKPGEIVPALMALSRETAVNLDCNAAQD
ncbi:MAG TPA: thioredoxin domain-containing protein [Polyangiaceae bacterium]|nr:thioredoxin domain-containing protein [Polyangiaceae bacterium]